MLNKNIKKFMPLLPTALLFTGCFGENADTPVWTYTDEGNLALVSTNTSSQELLVNLQNSERALINLSTSGSVTKNSSSSTTLSKSQVFTSRHGNLIVGRNGDDVVFELYNDGDLVLSFNRPILAADRSSDSWKVDFAVRNGRESPFRNVNVDLRPEAMTSYMVSDTSQGLAISRLCPAGNKIPTVEGEPSPVLGEPCDLTEHIGLDGSVLDSFQGYGAVKGSHFVQPAAYRDGYFRLNISELDQEGSELLEITGRALGYGLFDNTIAVLKQEGEAAETTYFLEFYDYDGNLTASEELPKDPENTKRLLSSLNFRTTLDSVWVLRNQALKDPAERNVQIKGYTLNGKSILQFSANRPDTVQKIDDGYTLKNVTPVAEGILATVTYSNFTVTSLVPPVAKVTSGEEVYFIGKSGELLGSIKPTKTVVRNEGLTCYDCRESVTRAGQDVSQLAVLPNLLLLKERQVIDKKATERVAAYKLDGVTPLDSNVSGSIRD